MKQQYVLDNLYVKCQIRAIDREYQEFHRWEKPLRASVVSVSFMKEVEIAVGLE